MSEKRLRRVAARLSFVTSLVLLPVLSRIVDSWTGVDTEAGVLTAPEVLTPAGGGNTKLGSVNSDTVVVDRGDTEELGDKDESLGGRGSLATAVS